MVFFFFLEHDERVLMADMSDDAVAARLTSQNYEENSLISNAEKARLNAMLPILFDIAKELEMR